MFQQLFVYLLIVDLLQRSRYSRASLLLRLSNYTITTIKPNQINSATSASTKVSSESSAISSQRRQQQQSIQTQIIVLQKYRQPTPFSLDILYILLSIATTLCTSKYAVSILIESTYLTFRIVVGIVKTLLQHLVVDTNVIKVHSSSTIERVSRTARKLVVYFL